jgi:polyvinyl alcohol dehydrogenase (cytochrome)
MLLRRGEPDDAEHAGGSLDSARAAYRELGMSAPVPTSSWSSPPIVLSSRAGDALPSAQSRSEGCKESATHWQRVARILGSMRISEAAISKKFCFAPRVAAAVAVAAAVLVSLGPASAAGEPEGLWLTAGHDPLNTRWQAAETKIGVGNAARLAPKWTFTTGGDVSATPAVDGNTVYVPDWAGNLFAIDRKSGELVWSHRISEYTGVSGDLARTTPAVAGNKLIFGDQGGRVLAGARVIAVDKQDGDPLWVTRVESHFAAVVTQSAVMSSDNTVVYVGVSSVEELAAGVIPGYVCCSFRGSVLGLDAGTGRILWRHYIVPPGFSGGAVWGSTPVVDTSRRSLYVGSGNNYSVPRAVIDCVVAAGDDPEAVRACNPPDNHFDSVLALDLTTGAVRWASFALPFDAWNLACLPGYGDPSNCPVPTGPDYDFGQGPTLFTVGSGSSVRELLGIGQKSGQYWALDPGSGAVVWVTQVGPGGINGGLQWGSASDGQRLYVADANSQRQPWTLVHGGGAIGPTVTSGFWSALDAATGRILWQTANPTGSQTPGAVSGANGVVFGCSLDPDGHMYALDAATGAILWDYASGGACAAGPSISRGAVYWGSGYSWIGNTANNKLYAFSPS